VSERRKRDVCFACGAPVELVYDPSRRLEFKAWHEGGACEPFVLNAQGTSDILGISVVVVEERPVDA
jgi:hypothetical protein